MKSMTRVLACFILAGTLVSVWAEDMFLTLENGTEIILHGDRTWEYGNEKRSPVSDETPITLEDGTKLLISAKGFWRFHVPQLDGTIPETRMETAHATGVAQSPTVSEAVAEATLEATKLLAQQLIKASKLSEDLLPQIVDCIANEEKGVETNYQRRGYVKATVKLSLDRAGIQGILRCIHANEEQVPIPN